MTRPTLTCDDPKRLFPPEALAGPGLAELGLDPAANVLREFLATAPPAEFPEHGWHRVRDDPDEVLFVAPWVEPTPWSKVVVGFQDGAMQPVEYGQCKLAIAAPPGVSFGHWWLDPDGPPVSADAKELAILVREQDCASGKPPVGRVLPPTIVIREDAVQIAIGIRKQLGGADCQGNPAHSMRLVLPEPVGPRVFLDASQYPPRLVTAEDPG